MKKTMHRTLCLLLSLICIVSISATFAYAVETSKVDPIEPQRYIGIGGVSAGLTINNAGRATCTGDAIAYSGYSVNLTMELQRDGATIKTWTNSGTGTVSLSKTYYVTSSHIYQVKTTAKVYSSSGTYVATYSCYSNIESY